MPGHFPCQHPNRSAFSTSGIEVFIGVFRLCRAAITLVKSTEFPFVVHCFRSEVDWSPGRLWPTGVYFTGNEVLRELLRHSDAGWPGSVSGSSLTLTGLRAGCRS